MSVITQIEFENPNKTYFSGQVVKGRASFTIGEEKTVRGEWARPSPEFERVSHI